MTLGRTQRTDLKILVESETALTVPELLKIREPWLKHNGWDYKRMQSLVNRGLVVCLNPSDKRNKRYTVTNQGMIEAFTN